MVIYQAINVIVGQMLLISFDVKAEKIQVQPFSYFKLTWKFV